MAAFLVPLAVALASVASATGAQEPPVDFTPLPERPVMAPVIACSDLPQQNFLTIEGAPARISAAEVGVNLAYRY
jgi:hypothetical protein